MQTSGVLGATSILLFFSMLGVLFLSSRKVPDSVLVAIGNIGWIIGGTLIYFLWVADAKAWQFVLPVVISVCGFPFIGAPNRSNFTKAVDTKPELDDLQGSMQAVLSMFASVAGFV